ncbi:hypothetical protein BAUCODRAFT_74281 [Baudoinia panamericana UAMH 10762]|uniref:TRIP4/RQT4 C2HC5-type zinc finger domain-containing protein n=1 Tax=Baudoinia panamericana (strain UAMH 10762) TaxID=717646 RepID=M2N7Q3_BAUPA|nr:uncharacterized protein BAUCODRAFT_74281 [Baudoinia panamericana UAMH 10762]EMC94835.1 hypothetical protein BAUCODRAFT_74281 [Baudoinia panamericana UAMH 10762]
MAVSFETWALPRLQQLLPLDEESLKQIVQYTDTLPKESAAEHLKNLLGDNAKALEFISSFNQRRQNAPATTIPPAQTSNHDRRSSTLPTTSSQTNRGRKKANIHGLPARQVESLGSVGGAYVKRDEEDYMLTSARHKMAHKEQVADNLALHDRAPDATKLPLITDDASATRYPITSKAPPSAAGPLISDSLSPKKPASTNTSRTTSPAPKAKVNISGGTAMHGASTTLSDLDSAIKSLEIQTNPSMSLSEADNDKRKCNCMATRHPLLDIAPNCLNCGKIICVKQGLAPCTFCGSPLLSPDDINKVLRVLKDERGEERQKFNNAAHKKADVAFGKARAYTGRDFLAQASNSARSSPLSSAPATPVESEDEASQKAKAHRDKLLNFQANNARRTQIHDEAADYDIPTAGTNMWASPAERAQQLKRQQKVLREMEWNARPEYEKRRVVASIDLKGGKVVRRMAEVEKPDFSPDDEAEVDAGDYKAPGPEGNAKGAFSNNPLAKGMIRPKAREEKGKEAVREKSTMWRRVQMDEDDNEGWILDGGVYGGRIPEDRVLGEEEHAFG